MSRLGLARRLGAITVSEELVVALDRSPAAWSFKAGLLAVGALALSPSSAGLSSEPQVDAQQSSGRRWIEGFEIFYKFAIAVIGTVWAIHSFGIQKDNLLVQLKTQDDSLEHQRQVSHAQFAASMISSLSEDPNTRRNLAISALSSLSPKYGVNFLHVLADSKISVPPTLIDRIEREEIEHEFSTYLADARKWQDYQIAEQAARQYVKAWSLLPQGVTVRYQSDSSAEDGATVVDGDMVVTALRAYRSGNPSVAAKLFATAFKECR